MMLDQSFNELSIRNQCSLLGISRSWYYYKPALDRNEDQELMNMIHETWLKHPFYGYRKIKATLVRSGYVVNHKKVQRLMKEMSLEAIYQKPKLWQATKEHLVYPYLLKDLIINKINQVWVTDLTYIKMAEGFIYLLAIMDLHSRFIVAAGISISMDAEFCVEVLDEAIAKYKVPEIFNTDQGSQFSSTLWINKLSMNKVRISMDGKGRCFDNIYIERFWRTIKYEEVYLKSYETVAEARLAIMKFVEFYNYTRPHQRLNYKTPSDVYFS